MTGYDFPAFKRLPLILTVFLCLALPVQAQNVLDRLGVAGPISFDGRAFSLAWSAQPRANFIKQEYLPTGQNLQRYDRMLLIERIARGSDVRAAVAAQVADLKKRQRSDPLVRYDLIENAARGEVILDFLLSGKNNRGETIVEWNAYRYIPHERGVLLIGISRRGYGDEGTRRFLKALSTGERKKLVGRLAAFRVPRVSVK